MNDSTKISTDALLAQFSRDPDPERLGELFDRTGDQLFRVARHLAPSVAEAEDLLQDTFLAVLQNARRYRPGTSAVAWMTGILRKQSAYRARQRRRSADPARLGSLEEPATEEIAGLRERDGILRSAILALPMGYRSVVERVLQEGMKPGDIAAATGDSPGAVRTRLSRALSMLRESLPSGVALPAALLMVGGRGMAAVRSDLVREAATLPVRGAAAIASTVTAKVAAVVAFAAVSVGAVELASDGDELRAGDLRPPLMSIDDRATAAVATEVGSAFVAGAIGQFGRRPVAPWSPPPGLSQDADGEFAFHYLQGFDFETGRVLTDPGEIQRAADVVFETCAGGISSITLRADGRLAAHPLRDQKNGELECSAGCYLDSVVALNPAAATWGDRIECDDRMPWTDSFVVKTREGGYAVCAIRERDGRGGDWTKKPAKIAYRLRKAPKFRAASAVDQQLRGFSLDLDAFADDGWRDARLRAWEERRAQLDATLAHLDAKVEEQSRAAHDRGRRGQFVGLLSRRKAESIMAKAGSQLDPPRSDGYVAATYSFEHETRDDVAVTRNDWDVQFHGSQRDRRLDVSMVTDDRSLIWNFGAVDFGQLGTELLPTEVGTERVAVALGDMVLIHTFDTESDLWVRAEVVELSDDSIILRWERLADSVARDRTMRGRFGGPQMIEPRLRILVRGGAGGGNPNRVFFDGSHNAYLDEIVDEPFSLEPPIGIQESARAFVAGGRIPDRLKWEVMRVEARGLAVGDTNGSGGFRVVIGDEVIFEQEQSDKPFDLVWNGSIHLRHGDERRCFVEIRNSSAVEVKLSGRFVHDGGR